ncbi:Cyclin-like superfamily [Arabidopsis suecica]|uniref:Cyclin-like superfamily n=1 Tax=Arabidopsis suecica TaxID=45249 RepID=A0A8T2A2W6_ARASU|nr:Cyclin-like superfamily [Arabidopsis suecica]
MTMKWGNCCRRCKQATVVTNHVERRTRCSGCGLEFKYRSIGDGCHVAENSTFRLSDPKNPVLSKSGLSIVTTEHKNGSFDDSLSPNLENSLKPLLDPVSIATTAPKNGSSNDFLSLTLGTSQNSETITASYDEVLRSDLGNFQNKALSIEAISDGLDLPATIKKRFCSELGLDSEAVEAAQAAAETYDYISIGRRSPISVAAGVVYAIARISYEKKLLKGIIEATGVAENTIKGTYEDLLPKLPTIIPKWFAKAKDLKNLGGP